MVHTPHNIYYNAKVEKYQYMTIAQLKAAESTLVRLSNEKMAPYAAFKLSGFLQAASEELKKFDDKEGKAVFSHSSAPENMDAFKAEIEPLLQQEVELVYIDTNAIMAFDITPTEAIFLRPFIDPTELE